MIPLHEPRFDEEDERYVLETLRTSWVSTGGPFVDKFEAEFAKFVGAKFAVSTCNGTIALQLMIETLKRQRGIETAFEALIPTLSFVATANAVVHAGGRPIFVDTAEGSLNLAASAVESLLRGFYKKEDDGLLYSKTSRLPLLCVIPVHVMGWGGEISKLAALCREYSIPMLEDAAESLGSRHLDSSHLGLDGLASCFSFNGNKILSTGGGGMIVSNDEAFSRRAKHLSTTAKTDALYYIHDEVGYNYRLVNILGALGVSQLEKLSSRLLQKVAIHARYVANFAEIKAVSVYGETGTRANNWLTNILLPNMGERNRVLTALHEDKIGSRPLWQPFHLQPSLSSFPQIVKEWPHATNIWERCLSLPSSPHLAADQIDRICSVVTRTVT